MLSKEFKEKIRNLYFIEKLTTYQIAKIVNKSPGSIQQLLSRNWGLKSISEGKNRFKLDISIFDNIHEEWKYYFLGWLYSDGNLYTKAKKNTISLCIQEEDKYILDYFNQKIFKNKKKLNYREAKLKKGTHYLCKPLWRFQIDSIEIVSKLKQFGLIENRSKLITFPDHLDKALLHHFIRGVFEGDGCITKNRTNKYKCVSISSASYNFIIELQSILEKNHIHTNIYKNKEIYSIKTCKKETILKFKEFIYKNCEMYLKRKKEKFIYEN